jgi:hypothetical protein
MPRDGALVLSDLRQSTLSIICEPCGRRGRYSVAKLMEQRRREADGPSVGGGRSPHPPAPLLQSRPQPVAATGRLRWSPPRVMFPGTHPLKHFQRNGLYHWEDYHMATPMPDILLLAIENWTALGRSVDFSTVTGTLNSSTSYTISDSTSGLSLNVVGTRFTTVNVLGYNLLATGTITRFTLSLRGKPIAEGSNYSLPASQLLSALETSVFEHKPCRFSISGSASRRRSAELPRSSKETLPTSCPNTSTSPPST